jgi:hypothetical protein
MWSSKTTNSTPGNKCDNSADCPTGLGCFNTQCLIPEHGSCTAEDNYCQPGLTCVNGECVKFTPSADSSVVLETVTFVPDEDIDATATATATAKVNKFYVPLSVLPQSQRESQPQSLPQSPETMFDEGVYKSLKISKTGIVVNAPEGTYIRDALYYDDVVYYTLNIDDLLHSENGDHHFVDEITGKLLTLDGSIDIVTSDKNFLSGSTKLEYPTVYFISDGIVYICDHFDTNEQKHKSRKVSMVGEIINYELPKFDDTTINVSWIVNGSLRINPSQKYQVVRSSGNSMWCMTSSFDDEISSSGQNEIFISNDLNGEVYYTPDGDKHNSKRVKMYNLDTLSFY